VWTVKNDGEKGVKEVVAVVEEGEKNFRSSTNLFVIVC